ncbi:hypothetical protein [Nitrincola iocasae]|uniref:Uncharacterized protein n=1 Tax=Nitrincola iocasae TaxID=2614693 RepID=A0A5J6LHL7_9GAMM|nr:hypothetical protein [Nitrincola iocasae]QEW07766.1 hypothetical protein F5I99_15395 [Nitrincola iocasae]
MFFTSLLLPVHALAEVFPPSAVTKIQLPPHYLTSFPQPLDILIGHWLAHENSRHHQGYMRIEYGCALEVS